MKNIFICFIHIEKCGGITLHHLIQNNFPLYVNLRSWYYWSNEPGKYFKESDFKKTLNFFPFIQGIGGHTTRTYGGYNNIINRKIFYLTFLREPISRYISHINYQRQVMGINWTLDDFLSDERFDNYQTVRLTGESDVLKAKQILTDQIDFVGIVEHFDKSLLLLNSKYPTLFREVNYSRKNTTEIKENTISFKNLNEIQKQRVIENNKLDIELYNYCSKNIFNKYLEGYVGDIEQDLLKFKSDNKNYSYPPIRSKLNFLYRNCMRYIAQPILNKSMKDKS